MKTEENRDESVIEDEDKNIEKDNSGRLMCIDKVSVCDPRNMPAEMCRFCGG